MRRVIRAVVSALTAAFLMSGCGRAEDDAIADRTSKAAARSESSSSTSSTAMAGPSTEPVREPRILSATAGGVERPPEVDPAPLPRAGAPVEQYLDDPKVHLLDPSTVEVAFMTNDCRVLGDAPDVTYEGDALVIRIRLGTAAECVPDPETPGPAPAPERQVGVPWVVVVDLGRSIISDASPRVEFIP